MCDANMISVDMLNALRMRSSGVNYPIPTGLELNVHWTYYIRFRSMSIPDPKYEIAWGDGSGANEPNGLNWYDIGTDLVFDISSHSKHEAAYDKVYGTRICMFVYDVSNGNRLNFDSEDRCIWAADHKAQYFFRNQARGTVVGGKDAVFFHVLHDERGRGALLPFNIAVYVNGKGYLVDPKIRNNGAICPEPDDGSFPECA
jgi:hypothetical protein